jgi:hypothetical protein
MRAHMEVTIDAGQTIEAASFGYRPPPAVPTNQRVTLFTSSAGK